METTTNDELATQLLVEALDLLQNGERWTQYTQAVDVNGTSIEFYAEDAYRFCATGALWKVASARPAWMTSMRNHVQEATARLQRVINTDFTVEAWNDFQRSFGPVQAAFRAAIEGGK